LSIFATNPGRALEISVLIGANLVATLLRFVLMREWVFSSRASRPTDQEISR
jgi:hypothetical protein